MNGIMLRTLLTAKPLDIMSTANVKRREGCDVKVCEAVKLTVLCICMECYDNLQ